jgi:AAA+ superfamily predicted ATPase
MGKSSKQPNIGGDMGSISYGSSLQRMMETMALKAALDASNASIPLHNMYATTTSIDPTIPASITGGNMPYKFKIGDRVVVTESIFNTTVDAKGQTGTIIRQTANSTADSDYVGYCVSLDSGETFGNHGTPAGVNFMASELELVNKSVSAGVKKDGVDWDSVILHVDKKKQISDTISQVDNHHKIFEEWGFGEIFEKGTAIAMLFYGEPGTGKTLMAQAIADKYGKKLQMVSTAEIETPEPGGAERNLKKYFTEADKNNSVLLFDECDSLITDRKRVGMILAAQINALLSELERYKGVVVFTTNRLEALDPAFERRLSLKLEFPMPDREHRVLIWKRMFPARAPLDKNIRWEDLASVKVAGGHIKNVVLAAARMAAANGDKKITDEVIWHCLEKEVESRDAYKEALDNNGQFYGTALPGRGASLQRVPGKRLIGS